MSKFSFVAFLCSIILCAANASAQSAATDPSADQIYQAAEQGRVSDAKQMVEQVLRDHPGSAKAHYVAAEVYAKAGGMQRARSELNTAERLKPGLPFADPRAVVALRTELLGGSALSPASRESENTHAFTFPWGSLLLIALAIGVVWVAMRRRREAEYRYAAQLPAAAGGPTYSAPPGTMGGAGLGAGIAGGLASGLAVGAGVVAGEELAHHFLDRDQHGTVLPPEHESQANPNVNADMGGNDFGLNSPEASSWDDDSSSSWDDASFGDGGGDWS